MKKTMIVLVSKLRIKIIDGAGLMLVKYMVVKPVVGVVGENCRWTYRLKLSY